MKTPAKHRALKAGKKEKWGGSEGGRRERRERREGKTERKNE